jgi:hypothetical protein
MKNIKNILSMTVLLCSFFISTAQTINWASLEKEQKHLLNFNVSSENALIYGVGYGYRVKSKFPIILNAEYSFPSGKNIADDFKTKLGGQIRWIQTGNFQFSTKIQGIFRRYENDYARLLNFGSDFSGIAGFYKRKWFVAGEIGFDKAIVTNFKHSDLYKENYPGVQDGWYEPPTGGHFYFDIQAGYSINKFDIYLKAGQLVEQDLKTLPLLPWYAQVGFNVKF